tara:strand:- start:889 stop:1233 length:345 start_codon:yes stop_codon:yes gene_type:complete
MTEPTNAEQSILNKFYQHQKNVKRASAKYYAKKNKRDYKDPITGQLFEFSKLEFNDAEEAKLIETKEKRKKYHAERYKQKAEYIKKQTKEYREKKKKEKLNSQTPLILSEPISV